MRELRAHIFRPCKPHPPNSYAGQLKPAKLTNRWRASNALERARKDGRPAYAQTPAVLALPI